MKHLKCELVDTDTIKLDPENARKHSPKDLSQKAEALKEFGQQKPIVLSKDNVIIAGNGFFRAATEILGWKKIAVVYSSLSPEEAKAYALADNQTGLNSEWDFPQLTKSIQELDKLNPSQNWEALGFSNDFVKPLISDDWNKLLAEASTEPAPEPTNDNKKTKPIKVNADQRVIIDEAIKAVRKNIGDDTVPEGVVIELICADYLADNGFVKNE